MLRLLDDFDQILPFLDQEHLLLNVGAYVEGTFDAEVWVNDTETSAYVFDKNHKHFLLGQVADPSFVEAVSKLLKTRYSQPSTSLNPFFSMVDPDKWTPVLKILGLFGEDAPVRKNRLLYKANSPPDTKWRELVPKEYHVIPLTPELLGENLDNMDGLVEELESMWGDLKRFFDIGFGSCALSEGELAGWCLGEYFSGTICGVGIETYPNHQRKGLATSMTYVLLEEAARRGLTVYWDCYESNVASSKSALKAGFQLSSTYETFDGSFDPFLNLTVKGDHYNQIGNFSEAIAYYKRAGEIRTNQAWIYWNIAVFYQKSGESKQALEALNEAVSRGWTELDHTQNSPHFQPFHGSEEWNTLIERIRRKSLEEKH